jgi:hypothetical protein
VPEPIELLELDIDLRLAELWRTIAERPGPSPLEEVAVYIRAAYTKGYCDALSEPERGRLCTDHGYRVPQPGPTPA